MIQLTYTGMSAKWTTSGANKNVRNIAASTIVSRQSFLDGIVEISMMREYSDNTIWSVGRRQIELKWHLSGSTV